MNPDAVPRAGLFRRLGRYLGRLFGGGGAGGRPASARQGAAGWWSRQTWSNRVRRAVTWWQAASPSGRRYGLAGLALSAVIGLFVFFLWTGVTAAMEARNRFEELGAELSHLSPVDLLQVEVYQSLTGRLRTAEQSAGRARSRLPFLGLLTWLPGIGQRIQESGTQLEMAYYLARGGRRLAASYQGAMESAGSETNPEEAARRVAEGLAKAVPQLLEVERDLQRARQLRAKLGEAGLDPRYAALIDTYLPQIQTATYISRVSPQVIGQGFVLGRELAAVGALATDPLQVLSNPAEVGASLAVIVDRSRQLAAALQVVERATLESASLSASVREEVLAVLRLMERGATLLEHATAGSQGLLGLVAAMEKHGLFTPGFAVAARGALGEAEARLALARDESLALGQLLPRPGGNGDKSLSPLPFGGGDRVSLSSVARLEVLLDRAFNSTRFLQSFLGFHGPRTYLVLGQNQQEIRATGGFIGVAVQLTLDQGELVALSYHESTSVDSLPPEHPNNPLPPEALYWYLWMGRLLFRDANWSPYFPTAAARVADLYRLGQEAQVDGVATGSKRLMVDMVHLLGNVRVPGLKEPLTVETAAAYTDARLPYPCDPERHVSGRGERCFDQDLFFAIRDRLTSQMSSEERVGVVQLFKSALNRNNILLHVFDPEEGSLLWELGWNGVIRPVDHDFLLVVDSSLPGHNAEGVRRQWDYQVSLQTGKPATARLRVRYDHEGVYRGDRVCRQSTPEYYTCYWNYFRIYLPPLAINIQAPSVPLHEGSERLIWGYPLPDSSSLIREADAGPARLTEMGGFIAVEPGSVTTIPLEYQLPWEMMRNIGGGAFQYRLLVQKQPGMDRDQVNVAVELPAGAKLLGATPAPSGRGGRWVAFEFPLESNREVVVNFKVAAGG